MTPLQKLKEQHQKNYSDMPFNEFAAKYRQKFYPEMTEEDFNDSVGITVDSIPDDPVEPSSPGVDAQRTTFDYLLDRAQAAGADFLRGLVPNVEMLETDFTKYNFGDPDQVKQLERDMVANAEKTRQALTFGGYEGLKPRSTLEQVLGTGVYETVREGPLAFVGARGPIGAVTEPLFSLAASTAGAAGSEVGQEVVRGLGGGETAQQIGGIIGGGITAGGTTGTRAVVGSATQAGIDATRSALEKRNQVQATVDKAVDFVATDEIAQVIKQATKAQPDIDSVIQATKDLEATVPGATIPPVAVLSGNPVYRKNTEYLLKTNPVFFQKATDALKGTQSILEQRKTQLFGKGGDEADAALRETLPKNFGADLKVAQKRLNAIDDQITKQVDVLRTDENAQSIGNKVSTLMNAKASAVRAKLSPQYEKLIKEKTDAGIAVDKALVGEIYNFVKAQRADDVFASFPSINSKIKQVFSPKKVPVESVMDSSIPVRQQIARGKKTVETFDPATLKDLDSLKREINLQLRKVRDEKDRRVLTNLKDQVDSVITRLPEEFSIPYKSLDAQYYQELGIPLNAEGVKQLDRARFETQAGKFLANAEKAQDFLAMVGDSGLPVVRDAIYVDMYNKVFSDGKFNTRAFNNYLTRTETRNLVETVPGLRNELRNVGNTVRQLEETRARLNVEFTQKSKEMADGFYKAFDDRGLAGVAKDVLKNPRRRSMILKDIKNFEPQTAKMVRQALRAEMVEQAMKTPGTNMIEFITEHKTAFNEVFGPTYLKDVENIARINDIVSKIDLKNMKFAIDYRAQDTLSETTGISSPQLFSVLRDRIASGVQKIAIIGSKVHTAKVREKRDSQLMELLLDPNALKQLSAMAEESKLKLTKPDTVEKIAGIINNSVTKGLYFGIQAAEEQAEQPEVVR